MNRNRVYQDQQVSFQYGTKLTGTIVRTSQSSIWAELSDGRTYRFVEGQDWQWHLYGSGGASAPLIFTNAPAQG